MSAINALVDSVRSSDQPGPTSEVSDMANQGNQYHNTLEIDLNELNTLVYTHETET
jgi:hypothetical protein